MRPSLFNRHFRIIFQTLFVILTFAISFTVSRGQVESHDQKDFFDVPAMQRLPLPTALERLANVFKVIIIYEPSDAQEFCTVTFAPRRMSIDDAMDGVVNQNSGYLWSYSGQTIRIFPANDRDEFISRLLHEPIRHFVLNGNLTLPELRNELFFIPSIKRVMENENTTPITFDVVSENNPERLKFDNLTLVDTNLELIFREIGTRKGLRYFELERTDNGSFLFLSMRGRPSRRS